MSSSPLPLLHLHEPWDEYMAFEISSKGWYSAAVAELPDGKLYPLSFYDPVRLAQEIASEFESGRACFTEPALVIVPELTEAAMRSSIEQLFQQGWFTHLVPSPAATPAEALRIVGVF